MSQKPARTSQGGRVHPVDLLRGIAMLLLGLDYVKDFVSRAHFIDPTDLDITTPGLFFSRWVTYFWAPIFIFLFGTTAYFRGKQARSKKELSFFLLTRGIFLILLEILVVGFLFDFSLNPLPMFLQVIWVTGLSMIILSGLVFLPVPVIGALALLVIFGHNLLDTVHVGKGYWENIIWGVLHKEAVVCVEICKRGVENEFLAFLLYPVIPWFAVMALGYAAGQVYDWSAEKRKKALLSLGGAFIGLFIIIRFFNFYGDPDPWESGQTFFWSLISFLNVEKFPPSLLFLLMTLGPGLVLLALFEGRKGRISQGVQVFGRAPLFFYLMMLFFSHMLAIILGVAQGFSVVDLLGGWWTYPREYGVGMVGFYGAWVIVMVLLYPICEWYADLKSRKTHWFFNYL